MEAQFFMDDVPGGMPTVLAAWGLKREMWDVVGFIAGEDGVRIDPVIQIADSRYILRRQPAGLSENDTIFRHALMRHLAAQGLPVPLPRPRPDDCTYVVVALHPPAQRATNSAEVASYELLDLVLGEQFTTHGKLNDVRLAAAATTLGLLHQAASTFPSPAPAVPVERTSLGIAHAYIHHIRDAVGHGGLSRAMAARVGDIADLYATQVDRAAQAIGSLPSLPRLPAHGDYQPLNLAFESGQVSAIYDFDAARYEQRIVELAYSLLSFTGVRWDSAATLTPPLEDRGLDLDRARVFLGAYGRVAPPTDGEARLLADALILVFPIIFANGAAEDLVFPAYDQEVGRSDETQSRLYWAETFWLWIEEHREQLALAWQAASVSEPG